MQSFAERTRFTDQEIILWRRVTEMVAALPDYGSPDTIRCHELARAVTLVLDGHPHDGWTVDYPKVVDGHYGNGEHSWIQLPSGVILDVYAIARMPMVQLVDPVFRTEYMNYKAGYKRGDINDALVTELATAMGVRDAR